MLLNQFLDYFSMTTIIIASAFLFLILILLFFLKISKTWATKTNNKLIKNDLSQTSTLSNPAKESKILGINKEIALSKNRFTIIPTPYIFVVEDDKMNRLIFQEMLGKQSKLEIAIDGDDGFLQLEKAIQSNLIYDIILLDINLPSPWDGIILLNEFKKKWPILKTIPFVAQTAYAFTGDRERFLAAGFDDYISKPIHREELFNVIENNLRKFIALKGVPNEK